jgi:hypothetical protein
MDNEKEKVAEEPVMAPILNEETNTSTAPQETPKAEEPKEIPVEEKKPVVEKTLSKKELKKKKQEEIKKRKLEEQQKKMEERQRKLEEKQKLKEERKRLDALQPKTPFLKILLILAVIVLGGYIYYTSMLYHKTIDELNNKCTPYQQYAEETTLDLDSILVKNLYQKVYTNIREDVAQTEWNNEMKLYLAFRQMGETEKYESNCNMFKDTNMEPYVCEDTNSYTPLAFHQDSLILEYKKLFGENDTFYLENIKLKYGCIGGYEYIPERQEYVQGRCTQPTTTNFKVTKTLKEAIAKRNTIILVEEVKYRKGEAQDLPDYLKSGTYYYTFKLDMNYNFILLSKTYEER